jgi:hypothetical protein
MDMATTLPPPTTPPLCECGCASPVGWKPGVGWRRFAGRGHATRVNPGSRLGAETSKETRAKQSAAGTARYKGVRARDVEDVPGLGVYATVEYKAARKLFNGKPCASCGSPRIGKKGHVHHLVPGDDSLLIPLCASCHAKAHHSHAKVNGKQPPPGAVPPLCACGCKQPVLWKRVRGWGEYLRGHGNAKVPAGTASGNAPLCACGCEAPVKFRHGKGWNKYRRGHGQRVEGHYSSR